MTPGDIEGLVLDRLRAFFSSSKNVTKASRAFYPRTMLAPLSTP